MRKFYNVPECRTLCVICRGGLPYFPSEGWIIEILWNFYLRPWQQIFPFLKLYKREFNQFYIKTPDIALYHFPIISFNILFSKKNMVSKIISATFQKYFWNLLSHFNIVYIKSVANKNLENLVQNIANPGILLTLYICESSL